ncbi:MAG TPA: TetR/AcrR family transcriptional regulator [Solirubrobacteraceae bacterium]|nr:TetR/AcrR family transcriptional regulator [Solirubrobacteraceae bacterium]
MPYRPTERTEARRVAARERVVRAASDIVAADGFAAASVAAVAARAGIAVGSVYRHFPSKGELFAELFRRASAHELDATRAAVEGADDHPHDRLAAAAATFAERALRGRRLAWALIAEPVDPLVESERLAFRRAYRDLFAEIVEDGVARGELPAQDAELTAAAVVGAIGEALVGPLSPVAPEGDPGAVVAAVVAVCLRATGATERRTP